MSEGPRAYMCTYPGGHVSVISEEMLCGLAPVSSTSPMRELAIRGFQAMAITSLQTDLLTKILLATKTEQKREERVPYTKFTNFLLW